MAGKWKFGPRADRLCLKWGQSCSIVKRRAHTGIASVSPPAAVATGRSEGDIVDVGVGGDSVESEGQTALLGDSGVVR